MYNLETINSSVIYKANNKDINMTLIDDNIWANKASICSLYDITKEEFERKVSQIFANEISETEHTKNITIPPSFLPEKFFSLDLLMSLGYQTNTKKASDLRIWSSKILKQFLQDGFIINEELLKLEPSKLNKLAAKIREIRANEKNIYQAVRDCFKFSASDYDPKSPYVRKFYILLQEKFHHAITRMTSSALVLDRANHAEKNMGLQTFTGAVPTKKEAETGKNYLLEDEIYRMYLLSEQFLLFAESTALAKKKMTMHQLQDQLDNLLKLNGYPVFDGYRDFIKDNAMLHAKNEYERFIEIKKLEHIGVEVDLIDFDLGEYNHYKDQIAKINIKDLQNINHDMISNGK